MQKSDLVKHRERLEKAIEKLQELDEKIFIKARDTSQRLDFVRSWKLSARAVKGNPMPAICLYGTSLAQGKAGAIGHLERELENTKRNIERL